MRLRSVCRCTPRRAAAGSHWPWCGQPHPHRLDEVAVARAVGGHQRREQRLGEGARAVGVQQRRQPPADQVGERGDPAGRRPAHAPRPAGPAGRRRPAAPTAPAPRCPMAAPATRSGSPASRSASPPSSPTSRTRASSRVAANSGRRAQRRRVGGDVDRRRPLLDAAEHRQDPQRLGRQSLAERLDHRRHGRDLAGQQQPQERGAQGRRRAVQGPGLLHAQREQQRRRR